MEVSILSGFWLVTSLALVLSYLIDQHPAGPNLWRSLLRWGKMRVGVLKDTSKQFYEVPKRWFQHFYLIGIAVNSLLLCLLLRKVFLDQQWPGPVINLMKQLQYPVKYTEITNAVPVVLVLCMECVQVCRRSYETFFVNIFSEKATMTLLHYILGFVYYMSIGMTVVAGSNFEQLRFPDAVSMMDLAAYAVAVLLFVSASILQHQSFRILAALRTDQKDKSKQSGYLLPRGGLFDKVSCPHFMAEIMVYFSFCIAFHFQHTLVLSLFVFVLVNQVIAALLTYQWYCKTFPGYGETRRAVFPFLL